MHARRIVHAFIVATDAAYRWRIQQATMVDDDGTAAAKRRCRTRRALGAKERRACVKSYLDSKADVTHAAAPLSEQGCTKPSPAASSEERRSLARCLVQPEPLQVGELFRRHLFRTPPSVPADRCKPFAGMLPDEMPPLLSSCVARVGEARWSPSHGLRDGLEERCGQRPWLGTPEARCLLAGRDLLFIGNSVVRRQMFTLLDLLAGPRAHRQVAADMSTLDVRNSSAAAINASWVWDKDGHENGYHSAQLFTVDLATGEHRFSLPHRLCGLSDRYSNFNGGKLRQWRDPGSDVGAAWRSSKWASREWRPMLSLSVRWPDEQRPGGTRAAAFCARPRAQPWAGSHDDGIAGPPPGLEYTGVAARLQTAMMRAVRAHFGGELAAPWLANVTVAVEETWGNGARLRAGRERPNVWVFFPTYHGAREAFNGFCEDGQCPGACTDKPGGCAARSQCAGKHLCSPMPPGSAQFVEHARTFAAALSSHREVDGLPVSRVRVSPFSADCWPGRDRCHGLRPCRERLDQPILCRASSLRCPVAPWKHVLRQAKAWVPASHPSASLLYLFDGSTHELFDATFRQWSDRSVGHGAHAIIFGPQFGTSKGVGAWSTSLRLLRRAVSEADTCSGGRTVLLFRSPAFNFDPVNSFAEQAGFARKVRPLVEQAGVTYLDNYNATFAATFELPGPEALKFAPRSAFHYLNAGRYLMAQLLLRMLALHAV